MRTTFYIALLIGALVALVAWLTGASLDTVEGLTAVGIFALALAELLRKRER